MDHLGYVQQNLINKIEIIWDWFSYASDTCKVKKKYEVVSAAIDLMTLWCGQLDLSGSANEWASSVERNDCVHVCWK